MNELTNKNFYTTTNWTPWLAIGIFLSSFFFSIISNPWLLVALIFLCFLPALIVAFALKTYFLIQGNKLFLYYDRPPNNFGELEEELSINLEDIEVVRQIGKSVVIKLNTGETVARRIKDAKEFVTILTENNSSISVVTY